MANKNKTGMSQHAKKVQNSGNVISNADIGAPYKFWKKMTVNPIGSAAAATALAGGAAYFGAPMIAKLIGKFNKSLPQNWQGDLQDKDINEFRKRLTLIAALGAGGLSVMSNINFDKPWKSMTNWDYGKKPAGKSSTPSGGLQAKGSEADEFSKDEIIRKMASYGFNANPAVMAMDIIPLDHAKEIVANDKYLTSDQKAAIGTIFDRTSKDTSTGNTSMADITAGAVRAGLGFAGGAIAGYALGKIFALPTGVTRVASVTGGLANALRASGLIT